MEEQYERIPIIKLWDQLLVPLQGDVNDARADRLRDEVLEKLQSTGATGLVVDITGLWMVDSHLCATLSHLAASAQLMGARTVLCGMSPTIALTLQTMGVELRGVKMALDLEEALEWLGIRIDRPEVEPIEAVAAAVTESAPISRRIEGDEVNE